MDTRSGRRGRDRTRADTACFLAGCAGTVGFFALEAVTRKPGAASSLATSDHDRGTTRAIGIAYALAFELPVLLRRLPGPQLPRRAGLLGLAMQGSGLALRTYSMRTLGRSYTRTLRTEGAQHVVDTGPYRWVRHPGYAGSLLTWVGYAITSRSVPALAVVTALLVGVYQRRIAAEETLPARELAEYETYSARTNKLVPFLW